MISKRMYEAMEVEDRPALASSSRLIGPGGSIIKELGKGNFSLKLGNIEVQVEAVVAEIDDDGLLGIDVLQNDKDGPADILLSKGVLMVQDKAVPMIQIGVKNRVRKVVAADHYVIPPMAESVIDVFVERHDYDFSSESECLIEPTDHFKETYPLQMAATLVDINKGCTGKIRILNPFTREVSIKQDAVVGTAEVIEGTPKILFEQENQTEKNNFYKVRRVDIGSKKDEDFSHEISQNIQQSIKDKSDVSVPEHLQDLFDRSTKDLNESEKERIADLLHKFEDSFSRNEWDI